MPKVAVTNDNVDHTVIRPIIFDIARQVQAWTGCAPTKIIFPGDGEVALQPGSSIDDENSFNRTDSQAIWQITIHNEHISDALLSTAVFQAEYDCYFEDNDLGLRLRPIYSSQQITINFELRTTDITEARRWRDEYRTNLSNNRNVRSHVVNYHYLIPKEVFPLIEHIHALMEYQGGYGRTYEEYLKTYFAPTVTQISNMAGEQQRWAVREQAGRITGQFDFAELPDEPQRQSDSSPYKQVFSYKIHFDCPISTAVDYPVLIHNQLIDQEFILHQPKDDAEIFASRAPRSVAALMAFEVDKIATPTVKSGLRLPDFHEFYPASVPRYTLQVLSALVGIENPDDVADNRKLMSFYEIDETWEFREEFLKHLRYDYQYLNRYGESLVNVTVYDNDMPLHHSLYYVDKDLNIWLKESPNIRRTYYVRLSLVTCMRVLSNAAKDRARENAEGLRLIGATLAPALVKQGKLPQPVGKSNYITRVAADKFFAELDRYTDGYSGGLLLDQAIVQWNTVMILYIETTKKEE